VRRWLAMTSERRNAGAIQKEAGLIFRPKRLILGMGVDSLAVLILYALGTAGLHAFISRSYAGDAPGSSRKATRPSGFRSRQGWSATTTPP
jgi:hypothetical protein